jgi:acetoin utilization protein AcuB
MIAADVMTENPKTILATDPLRDALEILQALEIRHLPVVDDDDDLVGMVSDRDLAPLLRTYDGASDRKVAQLMSSDVVSVGLDAELREVIETLLEQRIGAVPVVDGDGKIAGIISYVDLLRTYAGELLAPKAKTKAGRKAKGVSEKKTPSKKKKLARRR